MTLVKDSLTALDGRTYAVIKVVGVLIVLVFLALSVASFITGKPFDMLGFGAGAGAVVAAMGASIKLSETSEPRPTEPKP